MRRAYINFYGRDEVVVIAAEEFRRPKGSATCHALVEAMQDRSYILAARSHHRRYSAAPDLTIVSRDTSDFEKARVTVFNPWVEAAPPET